MKKTFLFLCVLLYTNVVIATQSPIRSIVFLGDSLTDNGRLYSLLLYQVPKSPPYFKGRFSNGPTWAENLAKYYYDKYYISSTDYALGAATAIFELPTLKFISSSTLDLQVSNFLFDHLLKDKSKVLVSIWIGNNDYMYHQSRDADSMTDAIVNKTIASIKRLIQQGVRNIFLLNIPDLSLSPYGRDHGDPQKLHNLVVMNNTKLAWNVEKLKHEYPNVKIALVDIYSVLIGFVNNVDEYNKKYNTNVTDITNACWGGGFFNDQFFGPNQIQNQLQQSLTQHASFVKKGYGNAMQGDAQQVDIAAMAATIADTPELKYVYNMGILFGTGLVPCSNPNEHLFWDSLHPTEVIHRVIALIVEENISKIFFDEDNKA